MRGSILWCCLTYTCVSAALLHGQATLVGPSYLSLDLPQLAPGQIITLQVAGLNVDIPEPARAQNLPLPESLAGISVTVRQWGVSAEVPVPLLSVVQPPCTDAGCRKITLITIQIPFEFYLPPRGSMAPIAPSVLTISAGSAKHAFRFMLVRDAVHIVNTCDTIAPTAQTVCQAGVLHADGTPVTREHPATSGDILLVFAYGLGYTDPPVPSGTATPAPPPTLLNAVDVQFQFGVNLPPQRPAPVVPPPGPKPGYRLFEVPDDVAPSHNVLFSGVSPGSVGLYQLNVQVPQVPADLPPCGGAVVSNLTITVLAPASLDGAGICVTP